MAETSGYTPETPVTPEKPATLIENPTIGYFDANSTALRDVLTGAKTADVIKEELRLKREQLAMNMLPAERTLIDALESDNPDPDLNANLIVALSDAIRNGKISPNAIGENGYIPPALRAQLGQNRPR